MQQGNKGLSNHYMASIQCQSQLREVYQPLCINPHNVLISWVPHFLVPQTFLAIMWGRLVPALILQEWPTHVPFLGKHILQDYSPLSWMIVHYHTWGPVSLVYAPLGSQWIATPSRIRWQQVGWGDKVHMMDPQRLVLGVGETLRSSRNKSSSGISRG